MKNNVKRAYECPETEELSFALESVLLGLSAEGREQDPVGGAEEGITDDWGWN